jgi:dienelactone hydrolase
MLLTGLAMAEPVTLKSADDVKIYGEYYKAEHPKALILLFHQAGSNRAEYATIAPRLVKEGYSALAIDQRSGGKLFGHPNETVTHLGHSAEYLAAEKDLEAALAWAGAQQLPVAIWGSSYSSSLVFLVAGKHPSEVKAVLSFSPGEYLGTPNMVQTAAAKVSAPLYVTSAKDDDEIAAAKAIVGATASKSKTQFIPKIGGVHGSSTLRDDRNAKGSAENWTAVLGFLKTVF